MLDQMQPPPRTLPLLAQLGRRQPDRRHQIPERQLREHARINLVGLARQRRRVAAYEEPVRGVVESMNGARFVHDELVAHGWEVLIADAQKVNGLARQPVQAVAIRRRREVTNQLALLGDQTHIDPSTTQIQPNV